MYTRIAGKKRHISDEEVATATLFLAGIGIYLFGILGGGYLTRVVLYIMYHFDWYDSELHSLSHVFVVFRDTNYTSLTWKPDGALHELGLLFTVVVIPILFLLRVIRFVLRWAFNFLFRRREIKERARLEREHSAKVSKEEEVSHKKSKLRNSLRRNNKEIYSDLHCKRVASMPFIDNIDLHQRTTRITSTKPSRLLSSSGHQ
mmetsp:Transcript_50938/g.77401  ORF Transcript_50938/g.77401 Transcript_50938/m.77401 type:complete len:203 (-) Transcript_50938:56-664(-)